MASAQLAAPEIAIRGRLRALAAPPPDQLQRAPGGSPPAVAQPVPQRDPRAANAGRYSVARDFRLRAAAAPLERASAQAVGSTRAGSEPDPPAPPETRPALARFLRSRPAQPRARPLAESARV